MDVPRAVPFAETAGGRDRFLRRVTYCCAHDCCRSRLTGIYGFASLPDRIAGDGGPMDYYSGPADKTDNYRFIITHKHTQFNNITNGLERYLLVFSTYASINKYGEQNVLFLFKALFYLQL